MASDTLVLLTDDKNLQNSDNIIAVINAQKSTPALMAAVDKVAAALDQPKLLALNKAVEIDRKTSQEAATGVRRRQRPDRWPLRRQRRRSSSARRTSPRA